MPVVPEVGHPVGREFAEVGAGSVVGKDGGYLYERLIGLENK